MCGFAGFWDLSARRTTSDARELVVSMADTLRHRGPDDSGSWVDGSAGVAIGHQRLAVVDLSAAGHQPMESADGRFVIAYNGEVYNHVELRAELEGLGHTFRGHSDTEVIVEAWNAWGPERCLERLIGMFAFAIWDREERVLRCARDRIGIKPLYWARFGETTVFGSELKALVKHPDCPTEVDRGALAAFLRHNYIPAPLSIYRGISKLEPGTLLTQRVGGAPRITRYWDLHEVARAGQSKALRCTPYEAENMLEDLLRDAVRRRMVADVPLGALLSGGIDSSIVVALMQSESTRPVRTFSIGFHERGYNEANHARAVARHLRTEHTEMYVAPQRAREVIPSLPATYDEPFADVSQIPTLLVSEMARDHVTVALSGDGGDELFGGYANYSRAERLWRRLSATPVGLKRVAGWALASASFRRMAQLIPPRLGPERLSYKASKLADMLATTDPSVVYRQIVSHWHAPDRVVVGGQESAFPVAAESGQHLPPDLLSRMQLFDMLAYLPDDVLTKVDRASMAVSLEVRVPILDHRVVEFAWRLPEELKRRDGQGKWLLRQVLHRHVPEALVDRPKKGFSVPIGAWLRGPLREWANALLEPARLRSEGYLQPSPISKAWKEHVDGRGDWGHQLWGVLMFQAWLAQR